MCDGRLPLAGLSGCHAGASPFSVSDVNCGLPAAGFRWLGTGDLLVPWEGREDCPPPTEPVMSYLLFPCPVPGHMPPGQFSKSEMAVNCSAAAHQPLLGCRPESSLPYLVNKRARGRAATVYVATSLQSCGGQVQAPRNPCWHVLASGRPQRGRPRCPGRCG